MGRDLEEREQEHAEETLRIFNLNHTGLIWMRKKAILSYEPYLDEFLEIEKSGDEANLEMISTIND